MPPTTVCGGWKVNRLESRFSAGVAWSGFAECLVARRWARATDETHSGRLSFAYADFPTMGSRFHLVTFDSFGLCCKSVKVCVARTYKEPSMWKRLSLLAFAVAPLCGCGDSQNNSASSGIISSAIAQTGEPSAAPVTIDLKQLEQMVLQSGATPGQQGGGGAPGNTATTKSLNGPTTKAIIGNWNFVVPSYCVGTQIGLSYYLYVVARDGGVLWTNDTNAIAIISPSCTTGPGIGVYITGISGINYTWSSVATYHP